MQRCLDCNTVLTSNEKVCPHCSKAVGRGRSMGDFLWQGGRGVFYGSILGLLVSRFFDDDKFILVMCVCIGLFILLMWAKSH